MSDETARIRARLERRFEKIAATRMAGLPVINPALEVVALGFAPFGAGRLGVLVTPWFMNLVLLPEEDSGWETGEKVARDLPAGRVEFIVTRDEELGALLMCSLFSPMFEFAGQQAALETAQAVLAGILDSGEGDAPGGGGEGGSEGEGGEGGGGNVGEGGNGKERRDISRRVFLRGEAKGAT